MIVFASGLIAGLTLDLLLARTLFAPPFRIWPTPAPGSWQRLHLLVSVPRRHGPNLHHGGARLEQRAAP